MQPRTPRIPAHRPTAAGLALALAGAMLLAACQGNRPDTDAHARAGGAVAARADTGFQGPDATAPRPDACLASAMLTAQHAEDAAPQELRFAVPCPDQMADDFISWLQRALIVRGYHEGSVSGVMDPDTAQAIRRFQRPRGLDSDILSLDAARALGLVVAERAAP